MTLNIIMCSGFAWLFILVAYALALLIADIRYWLRGRRVKHTISKEFRQWRSNR